MNFVRIGRGLAFLLPCLALAASSLARAQTSAGDWSQVPAILARIVPPVFPTNDFVVTNYGGIGDGVTDCTGAFTSAITACNASGGGRVVVPAGTYLTGAIRLLSNVNLYLVKSCTVRFITNSSAYLPVVYTRSQGIEAMNYSPFIYADQQQNIGITGEGALDGQASSASWYGWQQSGAESADFNLLSAMASTNLPVSQRVFGSGHFLRPVFVQPIRCNGVLIQGLTLSNSPMWVLNPVYCTNVTVRSVNVLTSGPNTDGCDPDSCSDVLVKNCLFNTGDDCSAIKAGRDADGLRVDIPSQNIIYQNCVFKAGHGGVTLGSETSGGISNVFAENCIFNSSTLQYALRFKTCAQRGGYIQNAWIRNSSIQKAQTGIYIDMQYCSGGTNFPIVRNLDIRDSIFVSLSSQALYLRGLDSIHQVTNVTIANCRFVSSVGTNTVNLGSINSINNKGAGF